MFAIALAFSCAGQSKEFFGKVSLDRTVHDFGRIAMKDGPVECSFLLTNISGEPIAIEAVVSSCGCTQVNWTRSRIEAGGQGTISATYSNDEGPYPFDKTLTVYISDTSRPIILHLRGDVVKKK